MSVPDPEKQPVMDLPSPVLPQAQSKEGVSGEISSVVTQQGTERNPELLAPQTAGVPAGSLPQPLQGAPAPDPAATTVPNTPLAPVAAQPTTPYPQIADDIDLIEKEWVEKAKEIVAKTKEDPRAQTDELDKVKAEYKKRRFNKDMPAGRGA